MAAETSLLLGMKRRSPALMADVCSLANGVLDTLLKVADLSAQHGLEHIVEILKICGTALHRTATSMAVKRGTWSPDRLQFEDHETIRGLFP